MRPKFMIAVYRPEQRPIYLACSILFFLLLAIRPASACTRAAPSFSIVPASTGINASGSAVYRLSVTNNDSACANTTFSLIITSETGNTAAFATPSVLSASTVVVPAGGISTSVTLTVTGSGAGVNGNALTTQVTLSDVVNHAGQNQIDTAATTIQNYNPLVHSSLSTASAKWVADGGWGRAGGKYGEFTCATCHGRNTGNIKRVRTGLAAPNGVDQFPIEAAGGTVSFLDARDGSSSFGDDAGGHATSNRICEGCHSQTKYHRYNTAGQPGVLTHYNQGDCIKCHKHKKGFEASCDTCHGNPPTAGTLGGPAGLANDPVPTGSVTQGAHDSHVTLGYVCNSCHTGWETSGQMPNGGVINIGFSTFGSTAGTYKGQNAVTYAGVSAGVPDNSRTCNAVYCHGGTLGGSAATWDPAATAACGSCHKATAALPPSLGSHPRHAGSGSGQLNLACSACHGAGYAGGSSAPAGHVGGTVAWDLSALAGSAPAYRTTAWGATVTRAPSASYGSCTGIQCHSDGTGGPPVQAPVWGNAATAECGDCHALPPASGAHASHYAAKGWATGASANCTQCHPDNSAVHSNVTDGVIGINAGLNYVGGSCSGAGVGLGCHNEYATPLWSSGNAVCTSCHTAGGGKAGDPASGLHTVTPTVSGQKHDQSVTGGCAACHSAALTAHWDGTVQGGNGQKVQMGLAAFYTQTADNTGTCATTACHRTNSDDWAHQWNSTANYYTTSPSACAGCHGSWDNTWNAGVVHRNQANTQTHHGDNGTNYDCYECHALEHANYTFAFGTNDWGGTSKHGNSIIEVNNNSVTYAEATGLCAPCHGDVDGTHNYLDTGWTIAGISGQAITVSCGSCHGGGKTPTSASGAHDLHGANLADETTCYPCHGNNGGAGYAVYTGSHNNTAVTFASVAYSTAVRNDVTGTCLTASCHNPNTKADQSTAWNSTALACDDCHYYATATTPTSAGNTAHGRPLSADHGNHFGTGATFACADCHGADPAAGDTSHINGATSLTDKAVAAQDEANVTVTTWSDAANSCANTACHNPSGTTYSAIWQTTTVSCILCHSTTNPGTGDHTDHLTTSATFGRTIVCTDCHVNNTGNNRHLNGVKDVQVRNTAGVFGTVATPAAAGGCGTNECHNSGAAAAPKAATYTWGNATPITDCLECHENGTTMASNAHNEHMNAGYTGAACAACHTAGNATSHLNRLVNLDSAQATYSLGAAVGIATAPTGTCTTASCHNRTVVSVTWNTAGDLTCTSCHGTAVGQGLSSSHDDHLNKGKACSECHGADPTTTAHIGSKTSLADGAVAQQDEAAISRAGTTFDDTANSCSGGIGLGCHATGTPDWDVAFATTACTNCHSDTATATVNPTSGLHAVTPSVSGQKHDSTVTGGCAACHPTVTVQATHINSTLTGNGSIAADRTAMGLASFYTNSGSDNTGTCATTACHRTNSDDWAHQWNSTANYYTTSPSACAGCHGSWDNTWNAGVVHRNQANTQTHHGDNGTNYDCYECHALEHANYTFAFGTNDWGGTSKHGNSIIEVNNNSVTYTEATGLCTPCHGDVDGTHNYLDTGWTIAGIAGNAISGPCNSCHAYPPTPGDGKSYQATQGKGAHVKHVNHIALRASITLDPLTDTFTSANVAAVCGVCHNTSADANHSLGGGARNMLIPTGYQFGASAPTYDGTVGQPSTVDPKSCSSVSCHFKATPVWE